MERLARRFALGASHEDEVETVFRPAAEATLDDLLQCQAIAIGSPEYFGTMAGMIKDFFDRTYEGAREKTIGLPFVLFVCAGNDGRGAITQIERITAGYKWRQALEHLRIGGEPTAHDLENIEELGHTMAAGVAMGIF
ncbi:MAG: flavodoxin family protein [Desulfobulbus sp.]